MAKKKSTETSENAVVNQENKEPKKKQEDILLEMIQRYRISHTKNGIFIHIPKTNGKLEAYNLNDSRLKIKLKSMFKDEVGEFPPDAVIQNCLQYTESHAMELPLEEVKYRIASRDKSVIYDLQNGKCVVVNEKGWRIVDNIYPMFLKGADEIEQVMPIHGSGKKGFDRIDRYLNLSPEEKFLLKVYLVTCFNPDITFPSVSIRPIITVSPVNDELLAAVGKLTAEYGRIGGNLNQIARTLNEWHSPYPQLAGEVRAAVSDLAALKFEVLQKVGDAVGNIQTYQL